MHSFALWRGLHDFDLLTKLVELTDNEESAFGKQTAKSSSMLIDSTLLTKSKASLVHLKNALRSKVASLAHINCLRVEERYHMRPEVHLICLCRISGNPHQAMRCIQKKSNPAETQAISTVTNVASVPVTRADQIETR